MSEPITVIPPPYSACEACGEEADGHVQLLRCSTCKNKFYCSARCQKKDWKEHKMNCSPLPVPLIPNVPQKGPEMTGEVERATRLLKRVFDSWETIDNDEKLKGLSDTEKLKIKVKEASFKELIQYEFSPEFKWKTSLLEKQHPLDRNLHSLRRLFWIDQVARIADEKERDDWQKMLDSMRLPSSFPQIVPDKVLACPGDLSPGEYEMLAQVANIQSLRPKAAEDGGTQEAEDAAYAKRWLHLAVIHKQSHESR
ncbi:hypothetical protein HDZ31DRAFT_84003 [Schizophyllum fasciatum]